MSYSLFLFNYQFYLVLDDNRGMVIAKQCRPPLHVSVYFVLDSNQGIIIVKSYRLVGSLRGVVGCCQARALRALGLLLADGAPTVGGGKTF